MKKFVVALICVLVLIACCVVGVSAEDTLPYEIEGVELLSVETVSNTAVGIFCIVMCIILAIAVIYFFVALVRLSDWDVSSISLAIILCIALVVSVIGIVYGAICLTNGEPTTTYKVTISEGVDYTEFTQHYEEVNREGRIYTIKLREG